MRNLCSDWLAIMETFKQTARAGPRHSWLWCRCARNLHEYARSCCWNQEPTTLWSVLSSSKLVQVEVPSSFILQNCWHTFCSELSHWEKVLSGHHAAYLTWLETTVQDYDKYPISKYTNMWKQEYRIRRNRIYEYRHIGYAPPRLHQYLSRWTSLRRAISSA